MKVSWIGGNNNTDKHILCSENSSLQCERWWGGALRVLKAQLGSSYISSRRMGKGSLNWKGGVKIERSGQTQYVGGEIHMVGDELDMVPDAEGARLRASGLGIHKGVDPFWAGKKREQATLAKKPQTVSGEVYVKPTLFPPWTWRHTLILCLKKKKEKKKQTWKGFNEQRPTHRGETSEKGNWKHLAHWLLSESLLLPASKTNSSVAWGEERIHTSQHDLSHLPTTIIKKTVLTERAPYFVSSRTIFLGDKSQQGMMLCENIPLIFPGLPDS